MTAQSREIVDVAQGSDEWKALRKTKVTATDAAVCMGVNPYKTIEQLLVEKTTDHESFVTPAMKRGIDLEPIARDLLTIVTGIMFVPAVYVKGWQMASLDGILQDGRIICEIKCPGKRTHNVALKGNIPPIYYPQIQHQMHVSDAEKCMYASFDGVDIVIVECERNDEYIEKLNKAELDFYQYLNHIMRQNEKDRTDLPSDHAQSTAHSSSW